jgi:acetate kinase
MAAERSRPLEAKKSAEIRSKICTGLEWMGIEIDADRNNTYQAGTDGLVSKDGSRVAVYVIPTDEELLIARDTVRCVRGTPQRF